MAKHDSTTDVQEVTSTDVQSLDPAAMAEMERFKAAAMHRPDDEDMRGIQTAADARADLFARFGESGLVWADEVLGTGWERVKDDKTAKAQLVEKPFIIYYWAFSPGDFRDPLTGKLRDFVTMWIVTEDDRRYIITDGSTGVCEDLDKYTKRTGRQHGLGVRRGFRRSDYKLGVMDDVKGKVVPRDYEGPTEPATTFYIDV